ncbi:NAD(P)-binding protein [Myriangium duriaei CBS 260.36]|uniref:NAD(P)-binding protein n=1 Tax=Myriangium duriaei CBS 260.36 TaxID=1168546 RepID=A0A9P4IUR1_9PEZI|nr:NAD(P)-binding protein [Myriangium duriaei CBS 260.36]
MAETNSPFNQQLPTVRRAFRRTDDFTPSTPKVKLVTEPLPEFTPLSVLIKVHAVSLNYRDANICNGDNPWPVTDKGIPCNDAAGEVIKTGTHVSLLAAGDRVAPINDTANLTNRETTRSWLAADEDGVLAEYIVFDERTVTKLPEHLPWVEAAVLPCAGVTAWSALKGAGLGSSVLIQGTGGVAMFALKLAGAAGLKVILSSSSDDKLRQVGEKFPGILGVNYRTNPEWHEEVLKITDGKGVDLVLEVGGAGTLVKSIKATRRGGVVSQVGYLSKQDPRDLEELFEVLIDRRVVLRGINCGSKQDQDDLCAAVSANKMRFDDIIDSVEPFEKAEEMIEYIWQGKQVGKVVLTL